MSRRVSIHEIDSSLERRIIIGMIVSTEFMKRIRPLVTNDVFAMSASRTVGNWCCDYFDKYSESPKEEIQDVYRVKSDKLEDSEKKWISEFLSGLSEDYENKRFNKDRLFEQARDHFKKQKYRKMIEDIDDLLDDNRLDDIDTLIHKSIKGAADVTDMGVNPFSLEYALKVAALETQFSTTLGMGAFDRLIGPLMSEWLIMFMAPMKRGKTRTLTHLAVWFALRGLNTVFVSLESGYSDLAKTIWMALGSLTTEESGDVKLPYFKTESKRHHKRKKISDEYTEREILSKIVKRPRVADEDEIIKVINKFNMMGRGRLILKSFPAYTAGVAEIEKYLDSLEAFMSFQPHAIIVDYLGAMKRPYRLEGRDAYDVNSKELKGMAQRRKALVASAHQGSRKTIEKLNMNPEDTPEDIRILGNVDALFGLMQTDDEKKMGVMRYNVLAHRFRRFTPFKQVKVLTAPEMGRLYLDGEIIDAPVEEEKKKKGELRQPSMPSKRGKQYESGE